MAGESPGLGVVDHQRLLLALAFFSGGNGQNAIDVKVKMHFHLHGPGRFGGNALDPKGPEGHILLGNGIFSLKHLDLNDLLAVGSGAIDLRLGGGNDAIARNDGAKHAGHWPQRGVHHRRNAEGMGAHIHQNAFYRRPREHPGLQRRPHAHTEVRLKAADGGIGQVAFD